ncbi:IS701 family transposase [Kitasatospora sp. GAS204B]|uniref:IS701 family transposase n=1 Tax=unclassified Kitasatospora TaxID=2633591 RepID=UPI00247392C8|nr:IS701 family transposase [Kitasatospora sp. GAS204B]MDH6116722.1 SRSO17 transposase [Kitasatospora sp. GAS204B]
MTKVSHLRDPFAGDRQDGISEYCRDLFSCFARSDQRRWGEVYLRGLLHAPGRRTPANITEKVLGHRAVQPIQQFVNQSTWASHTVRRYLAERVAGAAAPQAWAVDEVVFPKNGTRSAGVGRQFVGSAGRVVNCQLALATSLVHRGGSLPVNWHLMLPRHWDEDHELRNQAHVPAEERHRPRWSYVLESLDEVLEWNVPPAPVLADWTYEPQIEALLVGLEDRNVGYLVEVGPSTLLPVRQLSGRAPGQRNPAVDVALALGGRAERVALSWQDSPAARTRHSQFMVVPLGGGPVGAIGRQPLRPRRAGGYRVQRQLVVEWPFGRPRPRTYWVTNLPADRLADTVALAELRHHVAVSQDRLRQNYGLGDFEGRSFRGWHHHVTLASAALGFHTLQELGDVADLSAELAAAELDDDQLEAELEEGLEAELEAQLEPDLDRAAELADER